MKHVLTHERYVKPLPKVEPLLNESPEFSAACENYFKKFSDPLRHMGGYNSWDELSASDVVRQIETEAVFDAATEPASHEVYADDKERHSIHDEQ